MENLYQPPAHFRIFPAIVDQEVVERAKQFETKYAQQLAETSGSGASNQKITEKLISRFSDLYATPQLNDPDYEHKFPGEFENEEDNEKFFRIVEEVEDDTYQNRENMQSVLGHRQCDRWPVFLEHEGWLCGVAEHLCKIANNDWGFDLNYISQIEMLKYTAVEEEDKRGDHYDWHTDAEILPNYNTPQMFVECPKFTRKITVILQLSDSEDYEGGNLEVANPDGSNALAEFSLAARQAGTVIVFPSYLQHRITPVTKGERKSVVMWMNGRSWS